MLFRSDLVQSLSNDPSIHLTMDFQPGDIQLINNYAVLHAREGYADHSDPAQRRHLLRLWLASERGWPLPHAMFERYPGLTAYGRPAGIQTKGTVPRASLDPLAT